MSEFADEGLSQHSASVPAEGETAGVEPGSGLSIVEDEQVFPVSEDGGGHDHSSAEEHFSAEEMEEESEASRQNGVEPIHQDEQLSTEPAEHVQYMLCARCMTPLFRSEELIEEKASTWKQAVYPYELAICDRDCWCYSATNPHECRFDVVRVLPSAAGVGFSGLPTPEHSWFPGYAWRFAHCRRCRTHLGWSFSVQKATRPRSDSSEDDDQADSEPRCDDSQQNNGGQQSNDEGQPESEQQPEGEPQPESGSELERGQRVEAGQQYESGGQLEIGERLESLEQGEQPESGNQHESGDQHESGEQPDSQEQPEGEQLEGGEQRGSGSGHDRRRRTPRMFLRRVFRRWAHGDGPQWEMAPTFIGIILTRTREGPLPQTEQG